ncbi:hypothetical protein QTG54_002425 [Skeletonema marinoi]|uniref:Uncharacterized protein n=1 Tax=Skeletonema marinoi TaxID=267567 RepID=A0AAD8YIB2_9STRA|nr:hypothetical protein QTG54_002425 [Skeletonema marinoi]
MRNSQRRTRPTMESLGGDDGRRRRAQAILGARNNNNNGNTKKSFHSAAAETKSAPVDNNQEDDEEEAITTFWNLHDEVERLKEAQDIQVRDGVQTNVEDQDDGDGEAEEQYDIHYGENTGSNLGIFILPSDEDHSSSVSVDELRGDEEKTPSLRITFFMGSNLKRILLLVTMVVMVVVAAVALQREAVAQVVVLVVVVTTVEASAPKNLN